MNRLSTEDRCRVLACLVEGNSIRSTVRISGVCKRTVSRLLVDFGTACERFMDRVMTGLPCKAIMHEKIQSSPLPIFGSPIRISISNAMDKEIKLQFPMAQ